MSIYVMALALSSSPALAANGPDLAPSFIAPSGAYVDQSAKWEFKVTNSGNRDASNSSIVIQLPVTNTSPTVYVMGTVGAKSTGCTQSGTKITCSLSTVKKGNSKTVYVYLALPESAGTLDFSATVSTSSTETSTSNNTATTVASLNNYTPAMATGVDVDVSNRHCTGTGLESFYECELYPSSISSHSATFNADNTITIDGFPEYGGSWSVSGSELSFTYTEYGTPVAEFVGYGVSSSCWEGLTEFLPSSAYIAPYEVCF